MLRIWFKLLIVLASLSLKAQSVDWVKSNGWILYSYYSQGAEPRPADSLHHYDSLTLDMDTIRAYLAAAVPIPAERSAGARWMGAYWASCRLSGVPKVIEISTYGGFFVDQDTGIYYELPRPLRQAWLGYFRVQLGNLKQKNDSHGTGGG